jgi:hypothetical protein
MQGACFTISSLGHIGGTGFTPIVNAPEVAILGVSKATIQPVWDGKAFQPKLMLPLSLSYDHRVINGAAAARFTQRLGSCWATSAPSCCNVRPSGNGGPTAFTFSSATLVPQPRQFDGAFFA